MRNEQVLCARAGELHHLIYGQKLELFEKFELFEELELFERMLALARGQAPMLLFALVFWGALAWGLCGFVTFALMCFLR